MKRSGTRRPWLRGNNFNRALKVRNIDANYSAPSELHGYFVLLTRGDAPHVVRRLPLAFIFRAVGAGLAIIFSLVSVCRPYSAPLALALAIKRGGLFGSLIFLQHINQGLRLCGELALRCETQVFLVFDQRVVRQTGAHENVSRQQMTFGNVRLQLD